MDRLEQAVIDMLAEEGIQSGRRDGAPGVYVNQAKIASIGLKVRRGCTYHGLAFNVAMDLAPFSLINPCGFSGLAMTQLSELVPGGDLGSRCRAVDDSNLSVPGVLSDRRRCSGASNDCI